MAISLATINRIDDLVARTQAGGQAPALIAGVIRRGTLAHVAAAGVNPPPHAGTQSRIGSISKTFTAALVMGLRDDGVLDLGAPISQYLGDQAPSAASALTARDLLAHVSGLRREPDGAWWERVDVAGLDALLDEVRPDAAIHAPLRTYHYSNLAYGLLGAVVEKVTGATWIDALNARLLGPLGMARTTYHPQTPFLPGYVVHPHDGTLREEPRADAGAMAPAGQLWSTVDDLGKWAAFLAEPDSPVLSASTVAEMCAPVAMIDLESWTAGHGLGVQLWRAGDRVYAGHTGSMPGYLAVMMTHRPSRTGIVAFANTYNLRTTSIAGLGKALLTTVLDGEPEPVTAWVPASTAPPPHIAPLTGTWWFMGSAHDVCWDHAHRELRVTEVSDPADVWRFTETEPDIWRCHSGSNNGETMRVRRAAGGAPDLLDIATFEFTRDPWPEI